MKSLQIIVSLAAAAGLMAGAAFAQEQRILIGSSSSSHYGYYVAVSQLINDRVDGISATVVETGATMDNLRRLQRDQIDMGLTGAVARSSAWR